MFAPKINRITKVQPIFVSPYNANAMLAARAFLSLVPSVVKLMGNSGKIIQKGISGKLKSGILPLSCLLIIVIADLFQCVVNVAAVN